jgi:hypothetical protein
MALGAGKFIGRRSVPHRLWVSSLCRSLRAQLATASYGLDPDELLSAAAYFAESLSLYPAARPGAQIADNVAQVVAAQEFHKAGVGAKEIKLGVVL